MPQSIGTMIKLSEMHQVEEAAASLKSLVINLDKAGLLSAEVAEACNLICTRLVNRAIAISPKHNFS